MGHHVFSLSNGVGHAILSFGWGGGWVIICQALDIEKLDKCFEALLHLTQCREVLRCHAIGIFIEFSCNKYVF